MVLLISEESRHSVAGSDLDLGMDMMFGMIARNVSKLETKLLGDFDCVIVASDFECSPLQLPYRYLPLRPGDTVVRPARLKRVRRCWEVEHY